MKNNLKVIFVIIGTLIGAGFASGQEMYLFFFSYGIEGLIGILISSILMGFIIYKSLLIAKTKNLKTYREFLGEIVKIKDKNKSKNENKNKNENKSSYFNIKNVINTVINIFILITFFIMIAGFGAYFEQEFGINSLIGSSILAFLCFIVLMTNVKGVVKANEIIVPILIVFLIIIGIVSIKDIDLLHLNNYILKTNESNYILSSILYCSYNSILLLPVLLTLKSYIKDKKQISVISIISTIIIIVLSVVIFLLLARVDVDITKLEMPAVYVVSNIFKYLKYVYGFIILGSIFTTAISLSSSFLQNVSKNKKSYTQIAVIMCIVSVLVSKIGFSNLINTLYPIFGYLGLLQILKLILIKI